MSRKRLTINACAIAAILTLSYVLCRYIASRFAFAERLSRPVFITVALRNYHSITGHLPPSAEDRGHAGAPASWRVLILPQEGLNNVYTRYDFNQTWNSIQNKSLLSEIPENIYGCDQLGYKKGKTNYVAVIGPETVWAPAFTTGDVLRRNAYSGKCITTVWLIELAGSDIDWAEPRDLTVRDAIAYLQGSKSSPWRRPETVYGVCGSGERLAIPASAPTEILEALFSTDESKVIPRTSEGDVDFLCKRAR